MPWAMGSTAAKVAQHLRVPVLIVRASPPPHGRPSDSLFQNILIPLDGSEAGESALPYVRELAQQIEMNVTLLRVIASGQYVHTAGGLNYFSFPEQLIQNMRVEADQYLEKVQGEFSGTKAVVACEVKAGNAAQEIIKSCDENGIQLVAMSSHGHSGIERWILGSVSYKVLHSGKTPLLLVKAVPKTSV
jgi:nucleotide-binding universal stress UspA family protein